jgi:acetylornithine deacetylase/succinyl-diaminopimelate desuccinylase-like protein
LTVNHIRSFPDSTHTVQERCEFTLDRRLLPGDDPNEAFAEIERIAKEVERIEDPVSGKTYGIEVRLGPFMYPSLVTTDSPIVKAILRASAVMLGKPAETYYSPSAFDQGYLNHVGIVNGEFRCRRTPIRPHRLRHGLGRAHGRCGQGVRVHDAGLPDVAVLIPRRTRRANLGSHA